MSNNFTVPGQLLDTVRGRLAILEARRAVFDRRRQAAGGSLPRSDWWRFEYVSNPYLLGCPDDRPALRFHDVMTNVTELSHDSLTAPLPVEEPHEFVRKFAHLLEEYGVRRGLSVWKEIPRQEVDYFANGGPIAARMFKDQMPPTGPILVK